MKKLNTLRQMLGAACIVASFPSGLWAQQNIVLNEAGVEVLSPTHAKPAFGAVINYEDESFLIPGWKKSDYDSYPQITNLPTLYLTVTGTTPLDYDKKTETYYDAQIVIVDKHGTTKQRNEATTFRGRGNSTWNCNSYKKPWRLKFPSKTSLLAEWDIDNGAEIENHADAKSWTLLANHFDKSLIRNAVTHELGKLIGLPFCPAYRFVDLVLNGEYYGTYQISDHMEVAQKRVYVDSKDDWYLELCSYEYREEPYFSAGGCHFNVKNPDDNAAVVTEMTSYMNAVNNSFESWSTQKFEDLVDLASMADFLMGMDMSGNYDGIKGNGYCYKGLKADDKLKWGPLWDLDLGYNNSGGYTNVDNTASKHFWKILGGYNEYFFVKVYQYPEFQKVFYPRWKAVYEDGLATKLNAKIDEIAAKVKPSAILNYTKGGHNGEKWSMGKSYMGKTYTDSHDPSVVSADFDQAVKDIKDFISAHVTWLNTEYIKDYESFTGLKAADATYTYRLDDAKEYAHQEAIDKKVFEYRRVFNDTQWHSIMLPVAMNYDDWKEDFVIAKIDGVTLSEANGEQYIDIILKRLAADKTMKANTPYLIKAKKASQQAQVLKTNSNVAEAAAPQSLAFAKTNADFAIDGTYSEVSGSAMMSNRYVAVSAGDANSASTLKRYRCYLKATDKAGQPTTIQAQIRIRWSGDVNGDKTTSIADVASLIKYLNNQSDMVVSQDCGELDGQAGVSQADADALGRIVLEIKE